MPGENVQFAWIICLNYRKTTGSLWNYCRDKPSDPLSSNYEFLKYKTSITGNTYNVGDGEASNDAESETGKKWNWNCWTIKAFKQFFEKFKYTIN